MEETWKRQLLFFKEEKEERERFRFAIVLELLETLCRFERGS